MKILKVIIIGLGKQATKDHIPAVLRRNDVEITAVVDIDADRSKIVGDDLGADYFTDVEEAIKATKPDLAIVCVPHSSYLEILKILAQNKIATLKEKPLAMNTAEAKSIIDLYALSNTYLQVCVQRRFSKLYDTTRRLINEIGTVYSVYVEYALNLTAQEMASGWRSNRHSSGGGATIDMGYHVIDLLTYLFGTPDRLYAQLNFNSIGSEYTIDDTAKVLMMFNQTINANITITKVFNQKSERVRIFGDKGSVSLDGRKVALFDSHKNELESYTFNLKDDEIDRQLDFFVANCSNERNGKLLVDQLKNTIIVDAIYRSHEEKTVVIPEDIAL